MSEWINCKIKELGNVITGNTPSSKNPEDFGQAMMFVTPSDYSNYVKFINVTDRYLSESGIERLNKKILLKESIMVTCIGSDMGKVAMNRDKVITNQQINSIVPYASKVDSHFLFYKLKDEYETLRTYGQEGTAVPIVNKTTFENIALFIPSSLPEQESIAEVLSSLDDKIDLLHRNNKTLEELAETLFRQWFVERAEESWEKVTLKSLCNRITKGTTPTTLGKSFVDAGINFIKAESLNENGGFVKNKFSFIDESTHNLLLRSQIKKGDILFTIAGTIGRTSIVTEEILPANTNQAVAIIRVNQNLVSEVFMKYVMKSDYIQEIMEAKIVHAVQPNLSLGEISDTEICLPPKIKLNKFDSIVYPIQNKINNNNNQIQKLESLRDTLLPKLMSGSVRVIH